MSLVGQLAIGGMNTVHRIRGRFRKRAISAAGTTIHYYEGGRGDPLVMLHGLADTKESFLASAVKWTRDRRVILPDLLGHGANVRDRSQNLTIPGQVAAVHSFCEALGLERFDLGGNSMGGHTSLAYAIHHPDQVRRLILVNAPGLRTDKVIYSGFQEEISLGPSFDRLLDRVYAKRPALPRPIASHLIEGINREREFTNLIARTVREGPDRELDDRLAEVRARTLVLWGKQDRTVPFEFAERYTAGIPGARLVVLPEGGHSPQLEIPADVAREVAEFLRGAE